MQKNKDYREEDELEEEDEDVVGCVPGRNLFVQSLIALFIVLAAIGIIVVWYFGWTEIVWMWIVNQLK